MSSAFRIPPVALRFCGAVSTGILLATAFPPFKGSEAVWTALAPLLLVARYSDRKTSFKWGYIGGLVFWLIDMSWLLSLAKTSTTWPLAVFGWLALSAYLALYFGAFAMAVSFVWKSGCAEDGVQHDQNPRSRISKPESIVAGPDNLLRNLALMFVIPLIWVGFEYLRSTLFTGLAWNALGVSQYRNLAVIQIAEWGGVYAVSAIIVLMNVAMAVTFIRFINIYRHGRPSRRLSIELMTGLVICAACWIYGYRIASRIYGEDNRGTEVKIAAVQPCIPQLKKWDADAINDIYETLLNQTEPVMRVPGLQMIVWPETSVPGPVLSDADTGDFVRSVVRNGTPLLVGSMEVDDTEATEKLYNSSFLFSPDGMVKGRYRKQHLVPFGEYIPFDKTIRFIGNLEMLGFSCSEGTTGTVFRLDDSKTMFSVLICFEDTIASLAAESVRNGARLLINQTNDAWFDGTAGALQHMSQCVFRCVENRVPAVRCANSGVTCFIDKAGGVDMLKNEKGEMSFPGFQLGSVFVRGADMPLTFYTRYGDLPFAVPCAVLAVMVFVLAIVSDKREKTLSKGITK
jgi:apolipoprotein N-acyltransferase